MFYDIIINNGSNKQKTKEKSALVYKRSHNIIFAIFGFHDAIYFNHRFTYVNRSINLNVIINLSKDSAGEKETV